MAYNYNAFIFDKETKSQKQSTACASSIRIHNKIKIKSR